ncbi:hypothetical protein GYN24_06590 [Lactococcus piscium]|uniref:Uncharacterized protein n=2 Tax=Pseudolactococcus TaxID=3436058 RepID=A0A7L4WE31_9LACT|nr:MULTISPECIES: hypothetical protein [Lactococcus]SOB47424.1 hypothetical protein LPICM17_320007 [Lactococcus piscium]MCJ1971959.1 hypothetical protein [Lactococcus carnosus]MCJ1990789.1 hypothetical protein [Lactococcus carnosus]MCJ1992559.1 hypothetical protein [Lactococcus carnosus]MCJ1994246.1 hypothetical protein [Lactococcus paracarnosus]
MQVTGKTKTGVENQLAVEIFDIETVKTEIVQSIKNNDTLSLIDKVVDLYGDDVWFQSTKSIYDNYELYDLSKEELMVLGSLIIVSRFIP